MFYLSLLLLVSFVLFHFSSAVNAPASRDVLVRVRDAITRTLNELTTKMTPFEKNVFKQQLPQLFGLKRDQSCDLGCKMANPKLTDETLEELYKKYGAELRAWRPKMKQWCLKSESCKFCDEEAEFLYMSIREYKPNKVFEMAPNRGFSTLWILHALEKNGKGTLDSFDIHPACLKYVPPNVRWTFHQTDAVKFLAKQQDPLKEYDFIFIDALHTEQFSRWYTTELLARKKDPAHVLIHDIVAESDGGGRESFPVYQFLAFSRHVRDVYTLNYELRPNMLNPVDPTGSAYWTLRKVHMNLTSSQRPSISDTGHVAVGNDLIYFPCVKSPSIMFSIIKI